jgi:ribosome-binding factor A
MQSRRQKRICELLKRTVGEAIRREVPISEAGLVSVNDVVVSGDLRSAKVFITILGGPDQRTRGFEAVINHQSRLQDIVAKSVILKYTPKLTFILDDSIARGNRVLQIIDELEKNNPQK